jgi:hypothetical protein
MSSIPRENQVEGTWEEILSRGREFAGKRVRLTVLSEQFAPDDDSQKLRDVADRLMEEVEKLQPDAARGALRGQAKDFADGVAEKLRRQGIKS